MKEIYLMTEKEYKYALYANVSMWEDHYPFWRKIFFNRLVGQYIRIRINP